VETEMKNSVFALVGAVAILTATVGSALAAPRYPLGALLKRAETVLIVQMVSHEIERCIRSDSSPSRRPEVAEALAG
jgi:hypothetical protein